MRIHAYRTLARLALACGDVHLAGTISRLALERILKDGGVKRHSVYESLTQLRSDGVLSVCEWRRLKNSYGKLSAACHCRDIHRDSVVKAMRVTRELRALIQ